MDYYMLSLEFLSLFKKDGLSYAISKVSIISSKTWTIVCNFWNFFPFSINMDYHMQVLRNPFPSQKTWTIICNIWYFFSYPKNKDYHMQFLKFLSLLHKCG